MVVVGWSFTCEDTGIRRVLSLQLFSHFIPLHLGGLLNKQDQMEYFCFWKLCLKIMGSSNNEAGQEKWVGLWVLGSTGQRCVWRTAANPVSKAFLSTRVQYCDSLNLKALFCLILSFFLELKTCYFVHPECRAGRRRSWFVIVHSILFHIWNLLLCLFFFRLNCPRCILIYSSTPAALLDKQSNEYWNKILVYKKYGLWHE